ncbi:antitoxin [Pollutimonas subterranea]|uniref:Antitoxin n=1 Tax=Pollutimonas subterranea TaxID=2045210 RepID=A0A2N4U1A9_9BURK|nr:type II TA system antitoxin MqsA family protein [Pollutimonas subterranea]PLC48801.1 antitoxin [Pollutimonas subterranea]
MKCPICGGAELIFTIRDLPYSYKGHNTTINGISGHHCPACDEFIPEQTEGERVSDEMLSFNRWVNEQAGLPQKVARVRKKLKLSQREASDIFGGGVNAFSRYERGYATPSVALVKLLDVLERHPDLLHEVRESKVDDVHFVHT